MKMVAVIFVAALAIVVSAGLFYEYSGTGHEGILGRPSVNDTIGMSLGSDREVYHSSETMELNALVSFLDEGNYTVRVYGIKDHGGDFRVSSERTVESESGVINESFSFSMPGCYGCAGVTPGDYEMVMEILKGGEIVGNCSKAIRLEG